MGEATVRLWPTTSCRRPRSWSGARCWGPSPTTWPTAGPTVFREQHNVVRTALRRGRTWWAAPHGSHDSSGLPRRAGRRRRGHRRLGPVEPPPPRPPPRLDGRPAAPRAPTPERPVAVLIAAEYPITGGSATGGPPRVVLDPARHPDRPGSPGRGRRARSRWLTRRAAGALQQMCRRPVGHAPPGPSPASTAVPGAGGRARRLPRSSVRPGPAPRRGVARRRGP